MTTMKLHATGITVGLAVGGVETDKVNMTLYGPEGDGHATQFYDATVPDTMILPPQYTDADRERLRRHGENRCPSWEGMRTTSVANYRSWTAVSVEEMAVVAEALNLEALPIGGIQENVIIQGVRDFSALPPGSEIAFFRDGVQHCRLLVYRENTPCMNAARYLETRLTGSSQTIPKIWGPFQKSARGRRGLMGLVLLPGLISLGDEVRVFIPPLHKAWRWP